MTHEPQIPAEVRTDLCAIALDANKACLELFDAIERGDLMVAITMNVKAAQLVHAVSQNLRPIAMIEAGRIADGLGFTYRNGATHA